MIRAVRKILCYILAISMIFTIADFSVIDINFDMSVNAEETIEMSTSFTGESGNYRLESNITFMNLSIDNADVSIDLNGHAFTGTGLYIGSGSHVTFIDSGPYREGIIKFQLFTNSGETTLSGVTVTNEKAGGAGITNQSGGVLTLEYGVKILNCRAQGINNMGGTVNIRDGQIMYNGIGILNQSGGTLNVTGGRISFNDEIGIQNFHEANISNIDIERNAETTTANSACGIYNDGSLTLTTCNITDNRAVSYGGGIYNKGTAVINDCRIIANRAGNDGGGIYNNDGNININSSGIIRNSAGNDGGGIYNNEGTVEINNSGIMRNSAGNNGAGGGICNNDTAEINNCDILENSAGNDGGGIFSIGSSLKVIDSEISDNSAKNGGGICSKNLELSNSTLSGNNSKQNGGGICIVYHSNNITAEISDVKINNNTAVNSGGGIYVDLRPGDILEISGKCIIKENLAGTDPDMKDSNFFIYNGSIKAGGLTDNTLIGISSSNGNFFSDFSSLTTYSERENFISKFFSDDPDKALLNNGLYVSKTAFDDNTYINSNSYYVLTDNIERDITINQSNVVLDLNGKTIKGTAGENYVITVNQDCDFTVTDSDKEHRGSISGSETIRYGIENKGTLILKNGTISDNNSFGIYNTGDIIMFDGKISNNSNGIYNKGNMTV